MSDIKNNNWAQPIADNLNWNVLREYFEDNKTADEFKSMTDTQIEQWFLDRVNKTRQEQGLELRTIEQIRELLKQPYRIRT
jgi:hypothetical protein